jgi:hypothetical protein
MNTSLIKETNTKLLDIVENISKLKDEYEFKLAENKNQIDDELAKVEEYKRQFNEAKKTIQKMSDDINGFEEDYRNLVEKFQDDELSNILTGVSKEINAKIKEKKRNIQKDQKEMNSLIDKAQAAKKALVKLTSEKKALELVLKQITDVYKYYDEQFKDIITFSEDHFDNLHPDEEEIEVENEEDVNVDEIEIDEKEEIVTDEDVNKKVVEVEEDGESTEDELTLDEDEDEEEPTEEEQIKSDAEELDLADDDLELDDEEEEAYQDVDPNEIKDDAFDDEHIDSDDIGFNIENLVLNDDLDSDDEDSIREFLDKDELDLDNEEE